MNQLIQEEELKAPKYILNTGQQEALDWLVPFCLRKNKDYTKVLLDGWAGTGKTFTINRTVEAVRLAMPGIQFGMTAPTHKAVRVLKRHSELKDQLMFGTIHSFLALKQTINDKGEVEYKPDFNPERTRKIDEIDVLIVDESSMLDDLLFGYIEDEVHNSNLRVIFMGDSLQIPPVGKKEQTGESFAIPFITSRQLSHKIFKLVLSEPQRQAVDSPIIMYATNIRMNHNKSIVPWNWYENQKHALENIRLSDGKSGNIERLRDLFREYFCTPEFEADPDYAKVVAWRNTTVEYFNKEIRLLINNATELPRIIKGDKLVMDEAYVKKSSIVLAKNEDIVVLDVKVEDVLLRYKYRAPGNAFSNLSDTDPEKESRTLPIKVYKALVQSDDGFKQEIVIVHENSIADYERVRDEIRVAAMRNKDQFVKKDMWKEYYSIHERFQWVKHNYCLTAHKSQGSTYEYTFSMEWDMNQNRDAEERNRIKYVAATRSRKKLFVITQ